MLIVKVKMLAGPLANYCNAQEQIKTVYTVYNQFLTLRKTCFLEKNVTIYLNNLLQIGVIFSFPFQ